MASPKPPRRTQQERNALIEKWIGLASFVLHKKIGHYAILQGYNKDDLYSMACDGLIRAAELWDESRGVTFSTYAINSIARYVVAIAQRDRGVIHVPIEAAYEEEATKAMKVLSYHHLDMSEMAMRRPREGNNLDEMERRELFATLKKIHPRQALAIELTYLQGMTLEEAGKYMDGISKERVRQIRVQGIEKMKVLLEGMR